ncbi:hypothetical protein ASPCAL14548 [Aspergillus calidoustus]|uniref:N-acetylglucosamine-6-phosphate deacetylase n=1 Tax=Aspergillus calidoustus TaxID=454130 RepID=A0A0U5GHW0_ASPCI|nr:hypothetical protein ASPCAL14548 [Aspergillus calidoustus]
MATESSIVRFTNGLLACCGKAKREDLFIDTSTGKIIDKTDPRVDKALVVDLAGRILSPGLLEVQLNGAKGVDFSDVPVDNIESYASSFRRASRGILEMGVTSFLPTLVTSDAQTYRLSIRDLYGQESLAAPIPAIRKITLAPELPGMLETIRALTHEYGIICSLGHSPATYEQGLAGVRAGATMLTHLYNAMEPCLHRSPGLVGLIGAPETDLAAPPRERPFFGLIADGIHVAPSCVRMAWAVHREGCILTTDGTAATGFDLPDGTYEWTLQRKVVKKGEKLFLEGSDTIAGG